MFGYPKHTQPPLFRLTEFLLYSHYFYLAHYIQMNLPPYIIEAEGCRTALIRKDYAIDWSEWGLLMALLGALLI